jgi:radical SAM protein with 4Fe4S-binding SPASM domain
MTYFKPASGSARNRSDTGIYKLESFNFKKQTKIYTFIPELAIAFKNETPGRNIEICSKAYWSVIDNYIFYEKYKIENSNIEKVFIVPTGYCDGGCKYCYAKNAWDIKDYITPEIFDKTCKENNIHKLMDAIIYGGEPILNIGAFHNLIKHLIFNWKVENITVSTGMFYSDEIFEEFKKILIAYPHKLSISISIDPPSVSEDGYMRMYKGNDTYLFLLKRLLELMKVTDYIGIRMTLNKNSDNPFKLLDAIEFETGKRISCSIQPLTSGKDLSLSNERLQDIKGYLSSYMRDDIYSGKRKTCRENIPNPIGRLMVNRGLPWIHSMKDCDMFTKRLAIMPDGGISHCSEDIQLNYPKEIKLSVDQIHDKLYLNKSKECEKCDWKSVCGKRCFDFIDGKYFNTNFLVSCEYLIHCQLLAVELYVKEETESKLDIFCEETQKIAGISFS